MLPTKPMKLSHESIASVESLCLALDITGDELRAAIWDESQAKYTKRTLKKPDGTDRVVFSPSRLLRKVQRRINKRLFVAKGMVAWPEFVFGSIPNQKSDGIVYSKDYVACARKHCGAQSLLKMDIRNFFDNVAYVAVTELFEQVFHYPSEVSEALAHVCCYDGHLVQGGITSSFLAAMCFHDVEYAVVRRLREKGFVYTRYVDDITVSAMSPNAQFDFPESIISEMLRAKNLPENRSKTKVYRSTTASLLVHGLRIGFATPRLPSDEVSRIRASVRHLETMASDFKYRTSVRYRSDFNKCLGRVTKLKRVGHKQHAPLLRRVLAVLPLPSKNDVKRACLMVGNLAAEHAGNHDTYRYFKRFYQAQERLNVIQRSYPGIADRLRAELRAVKPSYD